jgi:hypothetical protein
MKVEMGLKLQGRMEHVKAAMRTEDYGLVQELRLLDVDEPVGSVRLARAPVGDDPGAVLTHESENVVAAVAAEQRGIRPPSPVKKVVAAPDACPRSSASSTTR